MLYCDTKADNVDLGRTIFLRVAVVDCFGPPVVVVLVLLVFAIVVAVLLGL